MKKLIALLLLLALPLCFTACGDEGNDVDIRVGYLAGTTGLGLAEMIAEDGDSTSFVKYDSPAEVMADMVLGKLDFAALPTNAFPKYYKELNGSIQMAAINTLGVLYIMTDGVHLDSLADLSGKTVYVPEAAPKLVLQALLRLYGVENVTFDEQYGLDALPGMAASGKAPIALLPEPKVTVASGLAQKNGKTLSVALDLSVLWEDRSDTSLVQGCMVVSRSFAEKNPTATDSFLARYGVSVSFMSAQENLTQAAEYAVSAGILPNAAVAASALPRCHLTFRAGEAMKTDAIGFFGALGLSLPEGEAYYGAE